METEFWLAFAGVAVAFAALYLQQRKESNTLIAWRATVDAKLETLAEKVDDMADELRRHEKFCRKVRKAQRKDVKKLSEKVHASQGISKS